MGEIIIIGGGVGGLCAAIACQRRGMDATVYEAASELQPIGGGIWISPNALQVLERFGLTEKIKERGVALDGIQYQDVSGKVVRNDIFKDVIEKFGHTTVCIRRTELQRTLIEELDDGTIELDKRCARVRQTDEKAIAEFADGTQAEGDVIIAADGIRSTVRQQLFPLSSLRYSGQSCYGGISNVDLPPSMERLSLEIWGNGTRVTWAPFNDEQVTWFAVHKVPEFRRNRETSRARLRELFSNYPDPTDEVIRRTDEEDIFHINLCDLEPLDTWYDGRIVLIGDAAHAQTPNLAQGAAQAIEDAFVVVDNLKDHDSPTAAFEAYEQIRMEKAKELVNWSWYVGKAAHLESWWARKFRNVAIKHMPTVVFKRQRDRFYSPEYLPDA